MINIFKTYIIPFSYILNVLFADQYDVDEELVSLDWKLKGTYELEKSCSRVSIPESYMCVLNEDAKKLSRICESEPFEGLEMAVVDESFENLIYFSWVDSGYVSVNDWKKINPKLLISEIIQNTEIENKRKKKQGIQGLHVTGWIQEPIIDENSNVIFYAIEGKLDGEENEYIFNSTVFHLGRNGYERITWVGDLDNYKPFGGCLDIMLRAHTFNTGKRYSDYIKGDKVAGYGIAALLGGTLGIKAAKAGGIILFSKKIWIGLGALIFAGFAKLKKIFEKV